MVGNIRGHWDGDEIMRFYKGILFRLFSKQDIIYKGLEQKSRDFVRFLGLASLQLKTF